MLENEELAWNNNSWEQDSERLSSSIHSKEVMETACILINIFIYMQRSLSLLLLCLFPNPLFRSLGSSLSGIGILKWTGDVGTYFNNSIANNNNHHDVIPQRVFKHRSEPRPGEEDQHVSYTLKNNTSNNNGNNKHAQNNNNCNHNNNTNHNQHYNDNNLVRSASESNLKWNNLKYSTVGDRLSTWRIKISWSTISIYTQYYFQYVSSVQVQYCYSLAASLKAIACKSAVISLVAA